MVHKPIKAWAHASNIKILSETLNKLLLVKNWKVMPEVQNVYSRYTRNKMK